MKLNLDDVTLCAADCLTPQLALRAITHSQKLCQFQRSILFTDSSFPGIQNSEIIPIKKLESSNDYSYFLLKQLNSYINTEFVLIIQWDGYVIEPRAWKEEFKNYDYIGAKWEWHRDGKNVGNGGFSFRSKKLLAATSLDSFQFINNEPEDNQICRAHRDALVANHSIKFANESIADAFSYERSLPHLPTFGFHGLFNIWRHCSDEDVMNMIQELNPRTSVSREFSELMIQYFNLRKFRLVEAMYSKIRTVQSRQQFTQHLIHLVNNQEFSLSFAELCEKLIAMPGAG
jgi:hypothetical protein